MTIRPATHDQADVAAAVSMGVRFIATSSYRGFLVPNLERLESLVHYLVDNGVLLLAIAGGESVGMLGLAVLPHMFTGEVVVADVAWWVDPEWRHPRSSAGGRLLLEGEAWARDVAKVRGVPEVVMQMMAPYDGDPQVGQIYKRRGFLPLETVFHKRLPAAA